MVLETRRALAIVTDDKERAEQACLSLRQDLAALKREHSGAASERVAMESRTHQWQLESSQMREQLAQARSEASALQKRVLELDEELAASNWQLGQAQDENAALVHECKRLKAVHDGVR